MVENNLDLYYVDGKLSPHLLSEDLIRTIGFMTMKDNGEMWWYSKEDKIWKTNGERELDASIKSLLGDKYKGSLAEEITKNVRASTYTERQDINENEGFVNLKNGVLNLETMKIELHSRDYKFTYCLPAEYNDNISEEKYKKLFDFFDKVFLDNPKKLIYLLEFFSTCLTTSYRSKKALMIVGPSNTGKTTTIKLMIKLLGGVNNISNVSLQNLCNDSFAAAELYGKIANIFDDLPGTLKISDVGIFKVATGMSPMRGNRKHKEPFNFINSAKLIFTANQVPVCDEDDIFYERFCMFDFAQKFNKRGAFELSDLTEDKEVISALLNLILISYKIVMKNHQGFVYEEDYNVQDIKKVWMRSSTSETKYLTESFKEGMGQVDKIWIYEDYLDFCEMKGLSSTSKNKFTRSLQTVFPKARLLYENTNKEAWQGIIQKNETDKQGEMLAPVNQLGGSCAETFGKYVYSFYHIFQNTSIENKLGNSILEKTVERVDKNNLVEVLFNKTVERVDKISHYSNAQFLRALTGLIDQSFFKTQENATETKSAQTQEPPKTTQNSENSSINIEDYGDET